jgi:hypothetical protein
MLIELCEDPRHVQTFSDLCAEVLEMLQFRTNNVRYTTVLGPRSPGFDRTLEENMRILRQAGERLHENDWAVLDLTSFQGAVERISSTMTQDVFLAEILDGFTLPLIRSKRLHTLHFMKNFEQSRGAVKEYEEALLYYDPWQIRFV